MLKPKTRYRWWLLGLLWPVAAGVSANSCIVRQADLDFLELAAGRPQPITGKDNAMLSPCEGRVKDTAASTVKVVVSRAPGLTEKVSVKAGQQLAQVVGKPLVNLAAAEGPAAALWKVVTSARPTRAGSRKFDDLSGLVLEGNVLAGAPLVLPLTLFGWDPVQPVEVRVQGLPARRQQPVNGLLRLQVPETPDLDIELQQGGLVAHLQSVAESEYAGLAVARAAIRNDPDPAFRPERETLLFWQMDLKLNAVSSHASDR
jgi:hypothetical protein